MVLKSGEACVHLWNLKTKQAAALFHWAESACQVAGQQRVTAAVRLLQVLLQVVVMSKLRKEQDWPEVVMREPVGLGYCSMS